VIVAKVGGSLYDEPRLGPALRLWMSEQPEPVLLVPGGGAFADAVRELDRVHGLGEESSHWLALRAMVVAAEFLRQILAVEAPPPGTRCVPGGGSTILNCFDFFREHDLTPHCWAVSSDSLAAAVAVSIQASKLVLMKSIDIPPSTPWSVAAANGWVDSYFPEIVPSIRCPLQVLHFRQWMKVHG
jgi:aspartokinase-like uncharacterized kinase